VAGALVLPNSLIAQADDLDEVFEEHGRWGLLCLSGYSISTQGINALFFSASPLSPLGIQMSVLAVLPLVVVFTRSRFVRGLTTVAYLVLWFVAAYQASPAAY